MLLLHSSASISNISCFLCIIVSGLMIDVSHHFIPLPLLMRSVDAMEISKMNVLHLHLTDSQSFPVLLEDDESLALSNLAKLGAYSSDKMYTIQDLKNLVEYCKMRGIQVIPEIDVPAHSRSV